MTNLLYLPIFFSQLKPAGRYGIGVNLLIIHCFQLSYATIMMLIGMAYTDTPARFGKVVDLSL